MRHPHVPTPQVKVMTTNNVPTKTDNWADKSASVIEKALDWIVGSMMFVMCAVIAWQIFSRYVLKDMSSWSEEVARFLMVWISLLGSAAVLRRSGHVTVTIFLDHISSKLKRRVLIIRDLLMLAIPSPVKEITDGLSNADKLTIESTAPTGSSTVPSGPIRMPRRSSSPTSACGSSCPPGSRP